LQEAVRRGHRADGQQWYPLIESHWLKGIIGDAHHAVLRGVGHNLRLVMKKLRLFCVDIFIQIERQIEWISIAPISLRLKI
jgi:hypothetical protein